jgi:tetratricopeptide (TPR) repeat protein
MTDQHFNALPADFQLQEYTLKSVLGHGGFGITYLAFDNNLGKEVAIKEYLPAEFAVRQDGVTVRPRSTTDSEDYQWGLDRFVKEAQTLALFRHPSVVPVYRFFQANGTAYMVMEYQRGQSLSELMRRHRGEFTEEDLMGLIMPVLDGLASVHKIGYLHRDLKPGNIFVREDGTPVLLDFGAARNAVGRKSKNLTSIVTPGYAPLEQYFADGNQGPWTDIYALAGILYQAVTGRIPPEAPARVKRDPIQSALSAGRGRYSDQFLEAIDAALSVEEEQRPQTVDEWRAMLLGNAPGRTEAVSTRGNATMLAGAAATARPTRAGEPSVRVATGPGQAAPSMRFPEVARPEPARRSAGAAIAWIVGIVFGLALLGGGGFFAFRYYEEQQAASLRERVDKHVAAARAAIAKGDFALAERELEEAAKIGGSNMAAVDEMRKTMSDMRRRADTEKVRQQVTKLIADARRAIAERRYDEAKRLLDEAEKLDPGSTEVQAARIEYDNAQRGVQDAERRRQVLRLVELARQAIRDKRFDEAERHIAQASQLDPNAAELRAVRQELEAAKRSVASEEQRRKQADELIEQARQAIRRRQYDEAEQLLRQAQQAFASHPDLPRVRADLDDARRRDRSAAEAEVRRLTDEARAAIQRKDWNGAEAKIAEAERLDPTSPLVAQVKRELTAARAGTEQDTEVERLAGEARAAIQRKDWRGAEAAIRQIERINPRAPALAALRRELDAARERDKPATSGVSCDFSAASLNGAFAGETDCLFVQRALTFALATGQQGSTTNWSNSRTGATGTVTIMNTTQRADGAFCRNFRQTVTHGGQTRTGQGMACKRGNGEWQIVG